MPDNPNTQSSRLDRIEQKIDKLSEIVISLARAEEKLVGLEAEKNTIRGRLDKHDQRIGDVERKIDESDVTLKVIHRIFWIVVVAGVSAYTASLFT